ncbi:hypothetical protein BGZ72_005282 [Mortierella alpina]|nr:hypothetical protein BGZ72_005282 [Mortierella alpina]
MPSSHPKVRYHAEYHSKINSISLSAQVPSTGLSCRIGPDAIDLIPSSCPDNRHHHTESLSLPARVMPTRTTLDQSSTQSSFLALKLTALPNMTSTDASSLKPVTFSEFPASPLPASQLQGLENLACGCCGSVLLSRNGTTDQEGSPTTTTQKGTHEYPQGPIRRVVDLPSEHWQELVDCWMCHEEDFTELREGDLGARLGQALVGGTYLLIHAGDVDRHAVAIEEDARSIDWTKGIKRRWRPLACSRCMYPVGDGWYQSRREDGTDLEMIQVKFHKYLVRFLGEDQETHQRLMIPKQRFAPYVAAEIFESARHHATYRFIIQDRITGKDMMLLWMLNWDSTILTNLQPKQDKQICWDELLRADFTRSSAVEGKRKGKKVLKVLYLKAVPEEDQGSEPSKETALWDAWRGDPGVERLEYQERLVHGLLTLLEQSTSCLPPSLNGAASAVMAMDGMRVGSFEI